MYLKTSSERDCVDCVSPEKTLVDGTLESLGGVKEGSNFLGLYSGLCVS